MERAGWLPHSRACRGGRKQKRGHLRRDVPCESASSEAHLPGGALPPARERSGVDPRPRRVRKNLESRAHADERPARRHPQERLAELDATLTSEQVLVADRRLAVGDVEEIDEELRRHAAEVIDVLRAQVELSPRFVLQTADRARRDSRVDVRRGRIDAGVHEVRRRRILGQVAAGREHGAVRSYRS